MTDALTVAYIAIGAKQALLDSLNGIPDDFGGGELEFIDACIRHADMLDALYTDGFEGVWVYEVAEIFGGAIASQIIARKPYDAADIARRIVAGCEDSISDTEKSV